MREWTLCIIAGFCLSASIYSAVGSEPYSGLEVDETGARRQARLQERAANKQCQPQGNCPQSNSYSYVANNCCENPWKVFGQIDALYWDRSDSFSSPNVIKGVDPLNFAGLDIGNSWGTRTKAGLSYRDFDVQFVYTNLDKFTGRSAGSLTAGIAFDNGILGQWAGGNFIDNSTYFSPIFSAATFNNGVINENDETDGFGPTATFLPALPTFNMSYRSDFKDFEINVRHAPRDYWFKTGLGYRKLDLDEQASISLRGELRDHTDGGGVNEGISHTALTDPLGGNLTHLAGAADGFDDTVSVNGPDTLLFVHQASVTNNLEGGQLLIEPTIYEGDYIIVDSSLKVGVFANQVTGRVVETYSGVAGDNSVYGRSFQDTRNVTSFLGNISLNVGFKVTDHILLKYGYEWLLMTDVGLAPDQYRGITGNSYRVNTDGDVSYRGSKFGLEAVW